MKRHKFLKQIMMCVLLPGLAMAQVSVVKSAGERKLRLDLSGVSYGAGGGTREFSSAFRRDLEFSGHFDLTASVPEFRLSGTVADSGGQVQVKFRVFDAVSGKQVFGKSYRADAKVASSLAHRVADDVIFALTGEKGFASTRIALIGNQTGRKELYVCDANGMNLRRVTNDRGFCVAPEWHPDGKTLVYTSYARGFPDVYALNLDSGAKRRISAFSGLNAGAAVSPDGREMALILSKDGNPELYVMNLSSGKVRRLTNTSPAAEGSPAWSPDGRQIAYVSDTSGRPQLYVISKNGGRPKRLTSRGSENVSPSWGKSGWIAFSSRREGKYHICLINPQTGQERQVTSGWADYEDPSWAPDGRHLVCTRTQGYRSSVCLLDTRSGDSVALPVGNGDWFTPSWAP